MRSIVQLAEAVTEALNTPVFSPPLNAERTYEVTQDLESVADRKVYVLPVGYEEEIVSRGKIHAMIDLEIVVYQRVERDEDGAYPIADLDDRMEVFEAIADRARTANLTLVDYTAGYVSMVDAIYWTPEFLKNHGVFLSAVTLRWRVEKAR
ncbi:MAG: hypothetical protein IT450_17990 [Phycisphaerales bacterium]|nr:hypothetical protein [Phycisphaerales bacterium]